MRWSERMAAGAAATGAVAVLAGLSPLAFAADSPGGGELPAPAAQAARTVVVGVPDMTWPDLTASPGAESQAGAWRWIRAH